MNKYKGSCRKQEERKAGPCDCSSTYAAAEGDLTSGIWANLVRRSTSCTKNQEIISVYWDELTRAWHGSQTVNLVKIQREGT